MRHGEAEWEGPMQARSQRMHEEICLRSFLLASRPSLFAPASCGLTWILCRLGSEAEERQHGARARARAKAEQGRGRGRYSGGGQWRQGTVARVAR